MTNASAIPSRAKALRIHPLALALASTLALAAHATGASTQGATSATMSAPRAMPAAIARRLARLRASPNAHGVPARTAPQGGIDIVTNCDDAGSGSLRRAIDDAADGDVIDMTGLTCSTITLTSGALLEHFDDLTLVGPGRDQLTIQSQQTTPVIEHYGAGTLGLYALAIANGRYDGIAPIGGCITSAGTLSLYRAAVTGCVHYSNTPGSPVFGGAIVARELDLIESTISGNAVGSAVNPSYGGGAWVWRKLYAYGGTVSDNAAKGFHANTGGIAADGDVSIRASTISGNTAAFNGGLALFANYATQQAQIVSSTISGNVATAGVGGVGTNGDALIANTTIAFNEEGGGYGGGLFVGNTAAVNLESSIVADNYSGGVRNDVAGATGTSITGANNLVMASLLALPNDTVFANPELAPLADNGGAAKTHALPLTSPALDAGNIYYGPEFYDQRGFARIVGGGPDIGAYELQTTGVVRTIASCADSGSGSLRDALDVAVSGDTLDLSALACGTISLTTGALDIPAGNLTLRGPGADRLTLDGNGMDRVIHHTGSGTLYASGLTFTRGNCSVASGCHSGGCIRSYSGLHLVDAVVTSCSVAADNGIGYGGAIYASRVTLDRTTISASRISGAGAEGYGGGVWAFGAVVRDSTISGNEVVTSGERYASVGGGILAGNSLDIERSTISGNQAVVGGGVLFSNDGFGARPLRVVDSTISGNVGGGLFVGGIVELLNSTVTLNTATASPFSGTGLVLGGTARIDSTILFGNSGPGGAALDIGSLSNARLVGANDLIGVSAPTVPPGTTSADPLLGPLADNGGPTLTHPLSIGSPAIDAGNNIAHLASDQRGAQYLRVFGVGADIGAFEAQTAEVIFRDGFE